MFNFKNQQKNSLISFTERYSEIESIFDLGWIEVTPLPKIIELQRFFCCRKTFLKNGTWSTLARTGMKTE